jgi:ABC-type glycerol-3-phosphate transport system substrate-binding protein
MGDDLVRKWSLSRRRVLEAAAGLGVLGPGAAFGQAGGPWSQAPRSKVDKLNFVVWTYGDIYTRIAKQFEADWGVKVESTISSFNDHPTKLTTMFAAGEKIDVSQSSPFSFPTSSTRAWRADRRPRRAPPTTSRISPSPSRSR